MTKNIKITLHNPSIADLKKNIIFFRSLLRKNISTQWRSGHRPFVDYFSWKKPPTFCLMNILFFGKKQNLYRWGTKNQRRITIFLFVLDIQKKTFHTKPHFGSKSLRKANVDVDLAYFGSFSRNLCDKITCCNVKTATLELRLHGQPTTITSKRKARALNVKEARLALAEHYVADHGWPTSTVETVKDSFTKKINGTPFNSPVGKKGQKKNCRKNWRQRQFWK